MAADYTFDAQNEWETGEFTNCAAIDPAGKLTPAVAPETIAELVANNNLSVYLRCREGSGTIVDNIATAGEDGTLSNADAWQARADGRHYLTGRSITVPYFAGMKVVDDDDHSWSYAAQMRVRFSEFSAQVLLQRNDRFKLGIDATGHPYVQNHYHISEVDNEEHVLDVEQNEWWYLSHTNLNADTFVMTGHSGAAYELDATNGKVKFTGAAFAGTVEIDYYHHEEIGWTAEGGCKDGDALSLDEWHELGLVCSSGYLSLYLDGEVVATLETYYSDNDPETDLVAACTGDWSDVMYVGEAESACLVRFPIQGSWSKEIEIGSDKTLRYLELDTVFTSLEHSVNIAVAFADSAAELDYARTWSWTAYLTGTTVYFPPKLGLLHGTWMKIVISISQKDYDRDAVLMDALRMWVRAPATVLYDYEQSPYGGVGIPEMGTPENLEQLIAKVKALYAVAKSLSREIVEVRTYAERAIPGAPGTPGIPGIPGPAGSAATTGAEPETPDWADMFAGWWTTPMSLEQQVSNNAGLIASLQFNVYGIHQELASHMASMQRLGDSIIDTRNQITAAVAAHAALGTGTHDLAANKYFLGSDTIHMTGQALVSAHNHILGKHGAGAGDKVGKPAVDDHNALETGIHGLGADTIGSVEDIQAGINAHSNLATGVHGAGASTLATVANIATHNNLETGIHGLGADTIGSVEDIQAAVADMATQTWVGAQGYATEAYADQAEADARTYAASILGTHAIDTSTHGHADLSQAATEAYVENKIESYGYATEAYASAAANAAVVTHRNLCTNYVPGF